jgi:Protein of unknown function (DUF2938)
MKIVLTLIAASVLSTLIMDISSGFLRAAGIISGTPPGLVGKWLESAIKGKIFVNDIRTSGGETVSLQKFLLYHYIIGTILTLGLYTTVTVLKIAPVPWWIPFAFGFGTTLIPALLMFPGMGFGFLGLKGPSEYLLLRTAILSHVFFGIGLTIAFRWVLRLSY